MNTPELLDTITSWATTDENVVALVLTGSWARGAGQTDEHSDYDLEIIAADPSILASDDHWLTGFGTVWVSQYFDDNQPWPTRLVFYEGGLKVDFTLAGQSRIETMVNAAKLDGLYDHGYKVLLDKTGITAGLPTASGTPPIRTLPTTDELAACANEFWFEAMHIPKYLAREDLWVVKYRSWTMSQMLLRMLEWHALATNDTDVDVWHIGSHMKQWVDKPTWHQLHDVFGRFDAADSRLSLLAITELFARLTRETAAELELAYNDSYETNVIRYIRSQQL